MSTCSLQLLCRHETSSCRRVQVPKANVHTLGINTCMFYSCSNFMVYNRLLIFAHYIDTEFQNILFPQFMRFRLFVLGGQPLAVDKCAVGRLDIANEDSAIAFCVYLGVLAREYF